jgi:hypothetical protein
VDELAAALDRFLEAARIVERDRTLGKISQRLERDLGKAFKAQGQAFLKRFEALKDRFPVEESFIVGQRLYVVPLWEVLRDSDWEPLFDQAADETASAFVDPLERSVGLAMQAGSERAGAEFGMTLSWSLENPEATSYLQAHGADLVANVNDTVRGYIRTVVATGRENGWSYDKMAKAISDRYTEFAVGRPQQHIDSRAHMIAVTETGEAYAAGNYQSVVEMQASGLEMEKRWVTAEDDRVSDLCAGNEAEGWIPVDQPHQSGHMHPLGHPACRCDEEYRRVGSEKAQAKQPATQEQPVATQPMAAASNRIDWSNFAPNDSARYNRMETRTRDAMTLADTVHDVPDDLPIAPIRAANLRGARGVYWSDVRNGKPIGLIEIDARNQLVEYTTLHEYGHYLDHMAMDQLGEFASEKGSAVLADWYQAVQESSAYQSLDELFDPRLGRDAAARRAYWLNESELFARSYAQWIAQRTSDTSVLRQIADIMAEATDESPFVQWHEDDFGAISDALEKVFRDKGWLKE